MEDLNKNRLLESRNNEEESKEIELEDTSSGEKITIPFSPSDIRISNPPMNMGDLIDMITYRYIDFDTEYQREGNLWKGSKPSRLIESIMLGLRLPAFYFEEIIPKKKWKIIDGLQRCWVIKKYCVEKTFSLDDLEFLTQFNESNYDNLDFDIKRDIRMLPITVNVLEKGSPDQVKYILFKRLNSGGMKLTDQEIRNAVFQGKVVDAIKEMAKYLEFLDATEYKIPTNRKQSEDFVSRFIAFYVQSYKQYEPDLDKFINSSLTIIQDSWANEQISAMKNDFKRAMVLSKKIFGNDTFRKRTSISDNRKPLNKAYFEVISNTFVNLDEKKSNILVNNADLLKENLMILMQNKTYGNSFSGGTGGRESVAKRFGWFSKAVELSVDNKNIYISDDNKIEIR